MPNFCLVELGGAHQTIKVALELCFVRVERSFGRGIMSCDCAFCLRFEIRDASIEGGFSKVHKALDRETDDFVAIKFINSSIPQKTHF
jgi:hypothetical protein